MKCFTGLRQGEWASGMAVTVAPEGSIKCFSCGNFIPQHTGPPYCGKCDAGTGPDAMPVQYGVLVYVRMDHLKTPMIPGACSVKLEREKDRPGYEGTIFPASRVFAIDNRDAAVRRANTGSPFPADCNVRCNGPTDGPYPYHS